MLFMKNVVELFSGNGDITKALVENGLFCYSVDWNEEYFADTHKDVYKLDDNFYNRFDFIWASPDCTTYSLASHGLHRIKGGIAVSDYAKQCDENNRHLVERLKRIGKPFIIENPRGHLRNMDFMKGLYRITVYYSTYGMPYAKPTDLFSNIDISKYFNQKRTKASVDLDYVTSYKDFLSRCKMPTLLIEDIVKCIKGVLNE